MSKADVIERIVLFADGTGNAFGTQGSNVWRLYEALDLSRPDQAALYIKGVGTAGFRPLAMLDGATGFGVPSNVRKLYRFLCWNWRPGVEIYVFGFSRGAFTIRTLLGLVASQGLVPTTIDGQTVSRSAMKRHAMAAWRAYRAETAGRAVSPLVTLTRVLRDGLLALRDRLTGATRYAAVRAATIRDARDAIPVRFAGLFDTVEAYGVPINELRAAVNWWIWPIKFRNRRLNPHVARARHALALDDERTTFHPVRFDMADEDAAATPPRIREVWFAGVHSDVGGGYPDDALAAVPLAWMMAEAVAAAPADKALRFRPGAAAQAAGESSPLAAVHDSRSGLAVLYRYAPRPIGIARSDGGPPVIHYSVAEKMVFGTENYAPLTLPQKAVVLMPDGRLPGIEGFRTATAKTRAPGGADRLRDPAAEAVARLNRPNAGYVALAQDMIWWRKASSLLLFGALVLAALLPVTAPWLDRALTTAMLAGAEQVGLSELAAGWRQRLLDTQGGLGSDLGDLSATVGGFLPSYATGWVEALVDQPMSSAMILLAAFGLYRLNGRLRDRIADLARCAWFIDAGGAPPAVAPRPLAGRIARVLRGSPLGGAAVALVARWLVPGVALGALLLAAVILVERTVVSYRSGSGALCRGNPPTATLRIPKPGVANRAEPFLPSNPCWPTGLYLEAGRTYALWIEMTSPYLDGPVVVGVPGYTGGTLGAFLGRALRRDWSADWFQPMAKIGATGSVQWPLLSAEGVKPDQQPSGALSSGWDWSSPCAKAVPAHPGDGAALQVGTGVRRSYVSQFTASGSGELFLFVNDAIGAVPFGPLLSCAYDNNTGSAAVTVELLPSPTPPPAQDYDFAVAKP